MLKLIENEVMKIIFKKKLILISVILLILIALFAYGENHRYLNTVSRYTKTSGQTQNYDWRLLVNQQISDLNDRLNRQNLSESNKNSINIQIEQYKYYLNNNINPITPSAAKFTVSFMQQAVLLFIPLLIIVLSGDIVSGEFSSRTIKILLTRAIPRWKILLSKYIALLILTAIVLFEAAVMSIVISSIMFHTGGWSQPVATGFSVIAGKLDSSTVVQVSQWQYAILVYGLSWFAVNTVVAISFMISVIAKNTASSIGIMMAALIGGEFLQFFLTDWPLVKYFFVINLNLPKYLTGSFQPIEGMNLVFSIGILCIWSIAALAVAFTVFIKKDILV